MARQEYKNSESLEALPSDVSAVLRAFLDGLDGILADNVLAVYLYGAIAFPDSQDQIQDIDFHVILRSSLDDRQREEVNRLHLDLAQDFPRSGGELDGYYITLEDTRRTAPPPTQLWPLRRTPVDAAWALHCAHIRAGRCIVLHGPAPLDIYPSPPWPDLEAALFSEIRYVDAHLEDAPAYCVLNACRLMHSFATHNVVTSKRASAAWALSCVPDQWHPLIEACLRVYSRQSHPQDGTTLETGVEDFVRFAWYRIAASRS